MRVSTALKRHEALLVTLTPIDVEILRIWNDQGSCVHCWTSQSLTSYKTACLEARYRRARASNFQREASCQRTK